MTLNFSLSLKFYSNPILIMQELITDQSNISLKKSGRKICFNIRNMFFVCNLVQNIADYLNLPLPPRTSTSTVKFFCSWSPFAKTVYFPACFLLERAGKTTTCPSLNQVTNGWGFPLTSQLRLSPSLTCSFVGQTSCGPTERKEKSEWRRGAKHSWWKSEVEERA